MLKMSIVFSIDSDYNSFMEMIKPLTSLSQSRLMAEHSRRLFYLILGLLYINL